MSTVDNKWFALNIFGNCKRVLSPCLVKNCSRRFFDFFFIEESFLLFGWEDYLFVSIFLGAGVRLWTKIGCCNNTLVRDDNSCWPIFKNISHIQPSSNLKRNFDNSTDSVCQCVPPLKVL